MAVALRGYQADLIAGARRRLQTVKRVLIQAPTGAGKTALATSIMEGAAAKRSVTLFICHRKELVSQTSSTFTKFGVAHSFIAAGRPFDPTANIFICGIDSLKNKVDKLPFKPQLIVWDECHHVGAAGWARVMRAFPDAYQIGLSATPVRLDGTGLADYFDDIEIGPSVEWLIEQGFLAPYRVIAPTSPALEKLRRRAGDFRIEELEKAMTARLTGDAVKAWQDNAFGKRTVTFCVSVAHSKATAQLFNDAGIPSAHLDGDTPEQEREDILRRFALGELLNVCNVELFTEGFDLAAKAGMDVTIDCVILLRPTQSLALYLQMVGRCLRPALAKLAVIIDCTGNTMLHGMPCEPRKWPLEGSSAKGADDDLGPPVLAPASCSSCFSQVKRPCGPICPWCGSQLTIPKDLPVTTKGQLAELKKAEVLEVRRLREEAAAEKKRQAEAAKAERARVKAAREQARADREAQAQRDREQKTKERKAARTEEQLIDFAKRWNYVDPVYWARLQLGLRAKYSNSRGYTLQ